MNIQNYFYTFEKQLDKFPSNKNYIALYKGFKDFMEADVHPEIKIITTRLDDTIYLNDHSDKHINMVIEKVSQLLGEDGCKNISAYELFFLLVAIQIHDAGHIITGRDGHEKASEVFLSMFNKYTVSAIERKVIRKIAEAHSGKKDPIGKLENEMDVSGQKVRTRLLAALLRFGDELADGNSRASSFALDLDKIPELSRLFHVFSRCLDTFNASPDSGTIDMSFCIGKNYAKEIFKKQTKSGITDMYLIDEIYIRSIKTYTECLYYNRFVPDKLRISVVNVKIHFLNEQGDDYYDPIFYRLEEKGYPQIISENIFELSDELKRDGNELTGLYISSIIKD